MSQPNPPADPAPTPPADPTPPAGDPPKDDALGDAGKRALQAERQRAETAEKELAKYRKAEQDKADADKSELQKAADKAAAAETRAAAAEARALRLEVATAKGLPASYAKRLVGDTREELEADADDLVKDYKPAAGDPADPAKPKTPAPDPSQGAKTPGTTRPTSLGQAVGNALKKA
jgi:hypothetical protein